MLHCSSLNRNFAEHTWKQWKNKKGIKIYVDTFPLKIHITQKLTYKIENIVIILVCRHFIVSLSRKYFAGKIKHCLCCTLTDQFSIVTIYVSYSKRDACSVFTISQKFKLKKRKMVKNSIFVQEHNENNSSSWPSGVVEAEKPSPIYIVEYIYIYIAQYIEFLCS